MAWGNWGGGYGVSGGYGGGYAGVSGGYGGQVTSPYQQLEAQRAVPMEHPSVTMARMQAAMGAGASPQQAWQQAYSPQRSDFDAGRAAVERRAPGTVQTQVDQLAARFSELFGTGAQVAVGIPTSGFSAETVRTGGVTTITVAPGVPATALPFIMGHEMGHAHQFRTGQVDPGAPDNQGVELGATFIAGQFLRRGGYALEDAVNYVRSGAAGDFLHGTVDQQIDALRRGYQSA